MLPKGLTPFPGHGSIPGMTDHCALKDCIKSSVSETTADNREYRWSSRRHAMLVQLVTGFPSDGLPVLNLSHYFHTTAISVSAESFDTAAVQTSQSCARLRAAAILGLRSWALCLGTVRLCRQKVLTQTVAIGSGRGTVPRSASKTPKLQTQPVVSNGVRGCYPVQWKTTEPQSRPVRYASPRPQGGSRRGAPAPLKLSFCSRPCFRTCHGAARTVRLRDKHCEMYGYLKRPLQIR
jgi:hypothetical protein